MNNEGLMIFIIQAILALFAFFVVAPCVLNAVSPVSYTHLTLPTNSRV